MVNYVPYSSNFAGGTCYVQAQDVLSYMQVNDQAQQSDYDLLAQTLIPIACDYIDRVAGTTWGLKQKVQDVKSIGKPMSAGFYLIGAPVYLEYFPVVDYHTVTTSAVSTLQSLQIWNGISYQEWVGFVFENRNGNFWVDKEAGIVYIIGWWWYMGYEFRATYYYGFNVAGTIHMPGDVKEFALLKSAQLWLDSQRYTAVVSQGIGGIEMTMQYNRLEKRIKELEQYFAGFRTVQGSFLP